nr:hypothetical protein Iba_scaffold30364CG0040 [Ipomoea batatas]GMD51504.1 hypothetical protein Iba_chr11bCG2940 [Ipomoea batatas]GMD56438.1 hypothetical protein Iba_chr11eCG3170 [Ipomoea batatas]
MNSNQFKLRSSRRAAPPIWPFSIFSVTGVARRRSAGFNDCELRGAEAVRTFILPEGICSCCETARRSAKRRGGDSGEPLTVILFGIIGDLKLTKAYEKWANQVYWT